MPRHLPWRILLTAVLAPVPGVCRATSPPALTTLRAVAESFLEPGPHGSVDVEAVVTGGYPNEAILLRDDSAATFAAPANGQAAVAPGDHVRVRGKVFTGVYINGIADATFERLGHGPVPEPRPVEPGEHSVRPPPARERRSRAG